MMRLSSGGIGLRMTTHHVKEAHFFLLATMPAFDRRGLFDSGFPPYYFIEGMSPSFCRAS